MPIKSEILFKSEIERKSTKIKKASNICGVPEIV
jgi:hypothetical protein